MRDLIKLYKMKLPNFICIGAQKSGTTTLHILLSKHPQIFLPTQKEIHYFDINYHKGSQWYAEQFSSAKKNQTCGEITPFYLFDKKTPVRIKALVPNIKLIILLRDPVDRTISHFYHAQKRGFEELDIETALNAEAERLATKDQKILQRHSYIARSQYLSQLSRYEKHFKDQQILVLKSEDLFAKSQNTLNKIMKFLEIDEIQVSNMIPTANKGIDYKRQVSIRVREDLHKKLAKTYIGVIFMSAFFFTGFL